MIDTSKAVALLPEKATKQVKPKPSRAEVIAAMLELKRQEYRRFKAKQNEDITKAREELDKAFFELIKTNPPEPRMEFHISSDTPTLTAQYAVPFNQLPPNIRNKVLATKKLYEAKFDRNYTTIYSGDWDEVKAKAYIVSQLKKHESGGVDRVQAMIEEPTIRKSLLGLLDKIERAPEPKAIEAEAV
jgi:hypothetical protein